MGKDRRLCPGSGSLGPLHDPSASEEARQGMVGRACFSCAERDPLPCLGVARTTVRFALSPEWGRLSLTSSALADSAPDGECNACRALKKKKGGYLAPDQQIQGRSSRHQALWPLLWEDRGQIQKPFRSLGRYVACFWPDLEAFVSFGFLGSPRAPFRLFPQAV